ncbi:hypothetical protein BKA66DRAFT_568119 [Pyrenochaeta sp. MPI-SDFR-AT-0127]|nr:hypothetical protein BKA66DRAFT_568119 [Pyrenochaeta sp. MPI-SDFR-AT-0127]
MSLKKWLRSYFEQNGIEDLSPRVDRTRSLFLQLPGEIRNQIYSYAIYSELKTVTVANCVKAEQFGASVLNLPIFRICRQIRAEALSYLCATKTIRIFSIHTANAFFDAIGTSISDVKFLTLVQPASMITPGYQKHVDRFFAFMSEATALKLLRIEEVGKMISLEEGGQHWEFAKQVQGLAEERDIEVQLRFGKKRIAKYR